MQHQYQRVKCKSDKRPYSKPLSAYKTAAATFAVLLPTEAGTHFNFPKWEFAWSHTTLKIGYSTS